MKPFAIFLIFAITLTTSCTKEDTKCTGIVCQNGGVCNDGTCDCVAGFAGTNCEIELEPLTVTIIDIFVTRFPPTKDNGETWDNSGGKADLRGFLFSTAGEVFRSGEVDNVNHNARTKLPQDNPIVMNATDTYRLSLVDDDNFSSDDFLGSHDFIPYSTNNGKPATLFYSNARIAFELKVTYGY